MKRQLIGVLTCITLLIPGSIAIACPLQLPLQTDDTTPPSVWFTQPKIGKFYPILKPIVIRSIQIWAHASDDESGIEYCELYIDDELKATFPYFPRSWTWNEADDLIFSKHSIKAVACDNAGNIGSVEIIVWKFF